MVFWEAISPLLQGLTDRLEAEMPSRQHTSDTPREMMLGSCGEKYRTRKRALVHYCTYPQKQNSSELKLRESEVLRVPSRSVNLFSTSRRCPGKPNTRRSKPRCCVHLGLVAPSCMIVSQDGVPAYRVRATLAAHDLSPKLPITATCISRSNSASPLEMNARTRLRHSIHVGA